MSSPVVPKLVVGYFVSSSIHTSRYSVAAIPAGSLTHLVYAHAQVDASGQCRPMSLADDQINLPQLAQLRARHRDLSILLGVGGPLGSGGFSSAAATPIGRTALVASCLAAMKAGGFDGIEIGWQTPTGAEAAAFTALLAELRTQLDAQGATDSRRYLLSTALPARVDQAQVLQIGQLQTSVDWINLMAYEFYLAATNPRTELQSALFASTQDGEPDAIKRTNYNVESAVRGYLSVGTPPEKLLLGLSYTGQIWTGVGPLNDGLYQPASGPGGAAGWLDYADIAANYRPTHQRYWSNEAHAPWLYGHGTQTMVSYDDAESIAAKVAFSISNKLAGVALWSLDADDAAGTLTAAVQAALTPAAATSAQASVRPYASEPFAVYQPLVGWVGQRNYTRVSGAENSTYLDRRTALDLREQGLGGRWTSSVFKVSESAMAVLSPIGLVHRGRQDFFELDTTTGPVVGQVWVSPGGTAEVAASSAPVAEDLADAVPADNAVDPRLAGAVTMAADPSLSLGHDAARTQALGAAHRRVRGQSERVAGAIRRAARGGLAAPVTAAGRRQVVANNSDALVNYELRRQLRRVAVQLQDLGAALAWQVVVDEPGRGLPAGGAGEPGASIARPAGELRAEERSTVFGRIVAALMGDSVRQVSADLLTHLFDIDEMIWFVGAKSLPASVEPPAEGDDEATTAVPVEQSDGDARRNEFLNAAWVKAVVPVRAGREVEALAWLKSSDVEGESGLSDPYVPQPDDPSDFGKKTVGDVLELLAEQLRAANTDIANLRDAERAYDNGFVPLDEGFRMGRPYQVFDQWIEILPTDQIGAVVRD